MTGSLEAVVADLDRWRAEVAGPFVLGICGAQGSGKSTLSQGLTDRLTYQGLKVAILSLDDLYLSHDRRAELAAEVHPLFATRGVPGTHDVAIGVRLLDDIRAGRDVVLPRFDKARDDPAPVDRWTGVEGPLDVLIFEGWCVGATPEPEAALARPVNALEAQADPEGVCRRAVNAALARPYADLFARIDRLVLLAAPGFEVVERWRIEQEHDLRRRLEGQAPVTGRAMTDAEVATFIQHYERLTRHILGSMPAYADRVLRLDERRRLKDSA